MLTHKQVVDVSTSSQHADYPTNEHEPIHKQERRLIATVTSPYTDKEVRLRARFREMMRFPMSSIMIINSEALRHARSQIPAMTGVHWPHIRFLRHRPHVEHNTQKHGWAAMTSENRILVLSCCLAYTGYVICRSHVPSLLPIIVQDSGLSVNMFGYILSIGLVAIAIGKVVNGYLADRFGGMIVFTTYLVASAATTALLALSPTTHSTASSFVILYWTLAWSLNRWFQSGAWGALVLLMSIRIPQQSYGMSLAIVLLGYSAGDLIARSAYGTMVSSGISWQTALFIGAFVGLICAIPCIFLWLKPTDTSFDQTHQSSRKTPALSVFNSHQATPIMSMSAITKILIANPKFVTMTVAYSLVAFIREIVGTWSTVFLVNVLEVNSASAATISLIVPVTVMIASNFNGFFVDRAQDSKRILIMQVVPIHSAQESYRFLPVLLGPVGPACDIFTLKPIPQQYIDIDQLITVSVVDQAALLCLASSASVAVMLLQPNGALPMWLGITILAMISLGCEIHNGFIEGFQVVALSVSVNRPATVSGLLAFCSNISSVVSTVAVGSIVGSQSGRIAWLWIFAMITCGSFAASLISLVSLRLGCALELTPVALSDPSVAELVAEPVISALESGPITSHVGHTVGNPL